MSLSARRAWIEIIDYIIDYATDASLSARRAWIEIQPGFFHRVPGPVALRKESVDRNHMGLQAALRQLVALRKESVDRNQRVKAQGLVSTGRSPQGERG